MKESRIHKGSIYVHMYVVCAELIIRPCVCLCLAISACFAPVRSIRSYADAIVCVKRFASSNGVRAKSPQPIPLLPIWSNSPL